MSKYKIILFTLYPNLLSYKALSVNTIYEMKVGLNIDGVFNYLQLLFKLIFMINIHKNKKRSCYIFILFLFLKKKTDIMFVMTPCVIHFNIMGFMQINFSFYLFLANSLC